jgi:hypothetical protein
MTPSGSATPPSPAVQPTAPPLTEILGDSERRLRQLTLDLSMGRGGMLTSPNLNLAAELPSPALTELEAAVDKADKALMKLDNHFPSRLASPDDASKQWKSEHRGTIEDLSAAIEAQNKLSVALNKYADAHKGEKKESTCRDLALAATRHARELEIFARQSLTVKPNDDEVISWQATRLSLDDNKDDIILRQFSQTINDLFSELDALQKEHLEPEVIKQKAEPIKQSIKTLQDKLDDLLMTEIEASYDESIILGPAPEPQGPVPGKQVLISAPREVVTTLGEGSFQMVELKTNPTRQKDIENISKSLELITNILDNTINPIKTQPILDRNFNELVSKPDISNDIVEISKLKDSKKLKDSLNDLSKSFDTFEKDMLKVVHDNPDSKTFTAALLQLNDKYEALCLQNNQMVDLVDEKLKTTENPDEKKFFQNLLTRLCKSCAGGSRFQQLFKSGLNELDEMKIKMDTLPPYQRNDYLVKAFKEPISLSTLAECYARGIAPEYMQLSGDDPLISGISGGHGSLNTVTQVTIQDSHGFYHNLMFKPENQARYGLAHMAFHGTIPNSQHMAIQRNIASYEVAKTLGVESVLVKPSAGTLHGQFGIFMTHDRGLIPEKLLSHIQSDPALKHQKAKLMDEKFYPAARAQLQCELCDLEWADLLSGQTDRHRENYLLTFSPDDPQKKFSIAGIDLDASFGSAQVGPGLYDLNRCDPSVVDELIHKLPSGSITRDGTGSYKLFDVSCLKNSPKDTESLATTLGLNSMYKPDFIDIKTYEKLKTIDEVKYKADLEKTMPGENDAIEAAMLRLRNAKELASQLANDHRVVSNWETHQVTISGKSQSISQFYDDISKQSKQEWKTEKKPNYHLPLYIRDGLDTLFPKVTPKTP